MKIKAILIELSRIILGVTLVLSGILKGVDPVGLEIKIQEAFIAIFDISHRAILGKADLLAYLLIAIEFCTGAFLLMGIYRRIASQLAFITILGFTVLTGYTYMTGLMPDCGCFGDAIKFTPFETFAKNLALLPLSIFLMLNAMQIKHLYSRREQWIPAVFAVIGIVVFIYYNKTTLPLIDFRPYKIGYNIGERIAQADSLYQIEINKNTRYIYELNGEQKSFSADSLPDSPWRYVEVKQAKSIAKNEAPVYSLLILTQKGEDMTDSILEDNKGVFLFVSPNWSDAEQSKYEFVNDLYRYLKQRDIAFYGVSPTNANDEAEWRYQTGAEYPNLFADATTIKTITRANPGLVIIKDGVIIDKLSSAYFPKSSEIATFVDDRLYRKAHIKPSWSRAIPLGIWGILLIIGMLRRFMRFIRAVYLKGKPQVEE